MLEEFNGINSIRIAGHRALRMSFQELNKLSNPAKGWDVLPCLATGGVLTAVTQGLHGRNFYGIVHV
jgi:hypothetical protein